MFEKLRQSKLFFWSVELLLIATFVFVLTKISFLFTPIGTFFSTLFAPILIAGFLYYLLNPLVNLLMKLKLKRIYAVIFVLLLLVAAILLLLVSVLPKLATQLTGLTMSIPSVFNDVEDWVYKLSELPMFKNIDIEQYISNFDISYSDIIQQFLRGLTSSLGSVVSTVASTAIIIFTAPFILFYMLKDGDKFALAIQKFFPQKSRASMMDLLGKMNRTLASYISGQAIECLFVGTFTAIGYSLIGVRYAFLFGVIAGFTNLIPYLGPYLGLAPAVFVTVFNDPLQAVFCCVVVLIVQQIDGNIIYPNVIGKTLKIHPLTIILVLLVAGNLGGLLGIFLGVPVYAIARTVVFHIIDMIKEMNEPTTKLELCEENARENE